MDPYFIGQSITLRGWFLSGATVGTIIKGQSLLEVRDDSGLDLTPGAPIFVEGAGALGGDLVTTVVSASPGAVVLTAPARMDANVRLVGTPINPTTVTLKVRKPDATEVTLGVSSPQVGRWEGTFIPTLDGDHFYRFKGSGSANADRWRKFVVAVERVP